MQIRSKIEIKLKKITRSRSINFTKGGELKVTYSSAIKISKDVIVTKFCYQTVLSTKLFTKRPVSGPPRKKKLRNIMFRAAWMLSAQGGRRFFLVALTSFSCMESRVRPFRLKKFFAYKRNEAKLDPFRMCFACSLEKFSYIFSLHFAYFRFQFFASLQLSYFRFKAKRMINLFSLILSYIDTHI